MPQATCYDATSAVKMNIDPAVFKASELEVPANNFWQIQEKRSLDAIRVDLDTRVNAIPRQDILHDAKMINARSVASSQMGANIGSLRMAADNDFTADGVTDKPMVRAYTANVDKDYMSVRIKQGYMPVPYRRFSGLLDIRYVPKPITPKPELSMILHFKVCSYLGDYGAGQTIKTLSLLPAEQMEISIRHYLRNETTKKQTQHILDSFSTSAADELQHTVEDEYTHTSGNTNNETKEKNWNVGANLGIGVGAFSFGAQGGVGGSKSSSFSSSLQDQVNVLDSSITKHVAKADTLRQIDVNSESSEINIAEEEETIKRTIVNLNKSRVLNFVFRQLLQEFYTITYLDNVTFSYTNGYPEKTRSCGLADLENMLEQILLSSTDVQAEVNKIYTYLCNIVDYTGTKQSFIELVSDSNENCINPGMEPVIDNYVRKRAGLSQTYEGKKVNGIILSTNHRITRTSSLICDAVLGQGEALDCYNQKLQDAASVNANLENLELIQQMASIEAITDPLERAEAYKKIFGNCCTTPQTQVIS